MYSFQVPFPEHSFLLQANTIVYLLSTKSVCVCVCTCVYAVYVSTYGHLLTCVYQARFPQGCFSTQSHTDTHHLTQSQLPTCDHADRTHNTRMQTHTQIHRHTIHGQKEKTSNIALFISVFPFTKSNGESRQLEKRNGGKSSRMYPIYPPPPWSSHPTPLERHPHHYH